MRALQRICSAWKRGKTSPRPTALLDGAIAVDDQFDGNAGRTNSALWDRFQTGKRPKELRPFVPIEGAKHTAPATPGDLFFHIRAEREDLCFEFERLLLDQLGSSVTMADEVVGFRYFDSRDLLGFVDGTANPTGHDIGASTLVGSENQAFAGGSYLVVLLWQSAHLRSNCKQPKRTAAVSTNISCLPCEQHRHVLY